MGESTSQRRPSQELKQPHQMRIRLDVAQIQFDVTLTPADVEDEQSYLAKGYLPVYAGPTDTLARVHIGGQAFNLLLSKTTTWEPVASSSLQAENP